MKPWKTPPTNDDEIPAEPDQYASHPFSQRKARAKERHSSIHQNPSHPPYQPHSSRHPVASPSVRNNTPPLFWSETLSPKPATVKSRSSSPLIVKGTGTAEDPIKFYSPNITPPPCKQEELSPEIPEPPPKAKGKKTLKTPYYFHRAPNQQPNLTDLAALAYIASKFSLEYSEATLNDVLWMAACAFTMQEQGDRTDKQIETEVRSQWQASYEDKVKDLSGR